MTGSHGARPAAGRLDAEYVLPLRWSAQDHAESGAADELRRYLAELDEWIDVTIVDGSEPELRERHREEWLGGTRPAGLRLLPVEPWPGRNGKVAGVMTGLRHARHERVVIADDDVRYDRETLARVVGRLDDAHAVRPQNVFHPVPWHAGWDSARSLLARATTGDFPGTLAVRRSTLLAAGGYDGDVLFENLELLRTVRAAGGSVARADDLLVERRPPSTRRFLEQRVRQAYDEWARPGVLAAELALLPLAVWGALRPRRLVALALGAIALAEFGRRRSGGARRFARTLPLWAPLWLAERAVTSWIAVGLRALGGVRYRDERLGTAAHSTRSLRERIARKPEDTHVA